MKKRACGPWPCLGMLWILALPGGGCGDDDGGSADAAVLQDAAPDAAWPPERASLLAPEVYDCNAVNNPPARVNDLPLGCFGDLDCEGLVVVAHRGLSYLAPQNTLSAARACIGMGIDLLEVDVRLSADGVPVLNHDADVSAATDATGDVDTMTVAELQALTLKVSESLIGDFSCERIATFRELLRLCKDRIDIMVDLKAGAAEAAVVIEEEQMIAQAIMLGSQSELADARAAVPDLRIMIRPQEHAEIQPLWDAFVPVPDVVHIDPGFDDPVTIDLIHSLGVKVLMDVWSQDAYAVMLGDLTGYAEAYAAGIDIQQSEFAFFPMWSVGRGNPP